MTDKKDPVEKVELSFAELQRLMNPAVGDAEAANILEHATVVVSKEVKAEVKKAENELSKALSKWEKKHELLDENKNTSLKWHYKDDVQTMQTIEKELYTLTGKKKDKNQEIDISREGDKANNTVVLIMIERVIKAWTEESPEKFNLLLNTNDPASEHFGPKTHYNLYNKIKGIQNEYLAKEK
ncbi:MAG: hypothetical protein KKF46_03545 [Nanoarchaeota archaeon]|nr:hypothetical protein [Nanoarchaeota archaeon]MBU1321409.1 hypothetical protein [Nanoarchaeota archaeon]MBU1597888.1 hypothetical protein [Nanoarchaeota archaeon]MBU2442269.1 hypothetical protein [Nanoarchaeota archaeon]